MRQQCIDMLYEHVSKELSIPREDYEASLYGWDIGPITIDERMVGVVMLRHHEIHICLQPDDAKRYARRLIRQVLTANLEKHGYLTTVSLKDEGAQRFLRRLGFYITGEDERFYSYRIDKIKIN